MLKIEYEVYDLPHYVRDHFGSPIKMQRREPKKYRFFGPCDDITIEAENASDARKAIKQYVQAQRDLQDRRLKSMSPAVRIARHTQRGVDFYKDDPAMAAKWARRYPLMYAEGGETFTNKHGRWVRIADSPDHRLFMTCLDINTGRIVHAASADVMVHTP